MMIYVCGKIDFYSCSTFLYTQKNLTETTQVANIFLFFFCTLHSGSNCIFCNIDTVNITCVGDYAQAKAIKQQFVHNIGLDYQKKTGNLSVTLKTFAIY